MEVFKLKILPKCPSKLLWGITNKLSHKEHLDRHIAAVHEKKKPFECSLCPRKFGLGDHLNKHIDAVHEKMKICMN